LPGGLFKAQYTLRLKTKTMAGFGLKAGSQFLFSIFDRQSEFSFAPALKEATQKIKTENLKIFKKQFTQYGADLKAHYFFPLIDATARNFKEKAKERFKQYQTLNAKTEQSFSLNQSEKEDRKVSVLSLRQQIEKLRDFIESAISA